MGSAMEKDMSYQPQLTQEQREKASELITELNEVLSVKNPRQKSILTSTNIIGMNRASAIQQFTEREYGFRNDVLDNLIDSKLELVKSRDAQGITHLINIVKTLQAQMTATLNPPPTLTDKLMGQPRTPQP